MNDDTIRLSPGAAFWMLLCALALISFILFSGILLPFVAGFALAYLLHPIAEGLCRAGVPRGAAAFAIISAVLLAIALIFALIVPPVFDQLSQLVEALPGWYDRARKYLNVHYRHYLQHMAEPQKPGAPAPVEQQITQQVTPWLISQAQGLLKSGLDLFNTIALLFLTPVVTFFLLRDWDKMMKSLLEFFPRQHTPTIRALAKEIDSTISGYLRGTLIVLAIVSAFYMVTLGLVGLNYWLLIGLCVGLISFVPYLGSTSGFLVSGGVALAQYWPDYFMVALVCGVFVFGQLMEGYVLTPNIVGNRVRLHPVWLLFALIASGYLLGFLGLLISVPLAAAIGVLVRYAIRKYYESPLYEGEGKAGQESG